jgi:hypothetical protein
MEFIFGLWGSLFALGCLGVAIGLAVALWRFLGRFWFIVAACHVVAIATLIRWLH